MVEISLAELYRILNRAIAKVDKCSGESVNEEIAYFGFEYRKQLVSGMPLSLFDEVKPVKKDVYLAVEFCDDLEKYRLFSDPYIDDEPEINERIWRRLYDGIQRYRPYINPKNLSILNGIEINAKHHLPEFRPLLLMQEFNQRACRVFREKKEQQKLKKKNEPNHKRYEETASTLFEDIRQNGELKGIPPCIEKIELLQNCLKLVDCLPKEKYNRTKKFRLKSDINRAIMKNAQAIGDNELAQSAYDEMKRFKIAEENSLLRSNNEQIQREIRRKKMRDDWDYK